MARLDDRAGCWLVAVVESENPALRQTLDLSAAAIGRNDDFVAILSAGYGDSRAGSHMATVPADRFPGALTEPSGAKDFTFWPKRVTRGRPFKRT